jgi:phosphatidylethanolamine-binding protein (PEBP) family uncharacterized protein
MLRCLSLFLGLAAAFAAPSGYALPAAKPGAITITVAGVTSGEPIPEAQALCTPTAEGKSAQVKAPQRPAITLSGVPKEAASVAIFMMDPDVPADFTDAGKDGKTLAADSARQDFFHYGLVNVPPQATRIVDNSGNLDKNPGFPFYVDPADPKHGTIELTNDLGLNGYVSPATAYGGPCPPWNDARPHHYHFIALALDKDAPVQVEAKMPANAKPGDDPMTAKNTFTRLMESKHVLATGTVVGTYTLNPALREAKQQ